MFHKKSYILICLGIVPVSDQQIGMIHILSHYVVDQSYILLHQLSVKEF